MDGEKAYIDSEERERERERKSTISTESIERIYQQPQICQPVTVETVSGRKVGTGRGSFIFSVVENSSTHSVLSMCDINPNHISRDRK